MRPDCWPSGNRRQALSSLFVHPRQDAAGVLLRIQLNIDGAHVEQLLMNALRFVTVCF
jgi:hypothetical protein